MTIFTPRIFRLGGAAKLNMNRSNMDMHQQQIQFEFPIEAGEFYLNCFANANRGGFSGAPFNGQLVVGCLLVGCSCCRCDVAAVIRCCCGAETAAWAFNHYYILASC